MRNPRLLFFIWNKNPFFVNTKGKKVGEAMIIVHVDTLVVPEKEEEYVKAMKSLMEATQKEPGNISYNFSKHMGEEHRYLIAEVWESPEASDIHEEAAPFKTFMKLSMEQKFAARPPKVIKFEGEISPN